MRTIRDLICQAQTTIFPEKAPLINSEIYKDIDFVVLGPMNKNAKIFYLLWTTTIELGIVTEFLSHLFVTEIITQAGLENSHLFDGFCIYKDWQFAGIVRKGDDKPTGCPVSYSSTYNSLDIKITEKMLKILSASTGDIFLLSENKINLGKISDYEKALFLVLKEQTECINENCILPLDKQYLDDEEIFEKRLLVNLVLLLLKSELGLRLGYKITETFSNIHFCDKNGYLVGEGVLPKEDSESRLLTAEELENLFGENSKDDKNEHRS